MNRDYLAFKAALATLIGTVSAVAGWKGIMLLLLIAAMLLDYFSGTLAAIKEGTWCSRVAREGLFHKGGIIAAVLGSLIADALLEVAVPILPIAGGMENPGLLLPLVLAWYIITETGSVMENSAKMGAPLPKWFLRATCNIRQRIDSTGDAAASAIAPEEK